MCVTLYFIRLIFYAVNSKEASWERRKNYHWSSMIWFTRFDRRAETMKTNQRKMVVEYIRMLFLFSRSATSELCKHTFINYVGFEREFNVERLLWLDNIPWRKHYSMYEIDLKKKITEVDTKQLIGSLSNS